MISIIAAIGKNREIGKKNGLLWHIPEELKHFKKITYGHPIIMGRKTYESIGRPLPGRTNIVISCHSRNSGMRKAIIEPQDLLWANSLDASIAIAKKQPGAEEIFVIGGASIFKQALPLVDKLYLTLIDKEFPQADAYFPDYAGFSRMIKQEKNKSSDHKIGTYVFIELAR